MKIGRSFEIEKDDHDHEKQKKTSLKKEISNLNYINVGGYLIAPILVGLLFGFYLDRVFHTKPFFILGFLFFGFIASIYNLWKLTKNA